MPRTHPERGRLSPHGGHSLSDDEVRDFENGYWYSEQLKHFAERIGISAAKKLRKDELEKAIIAFLHYAQVTNENWSITSSALPRISRTGRAASSPNNQASTALDSA
jgi:hypothetical protein